jgi:hypothetical protein
VSIRRLFANDKSITGCGQEGKLTLGDGYLNAVVSGQWSVLAAGFFVEGSVFH